MPKTSQQLRALARDATSRARRAPAVEATRLRAYARALHRRALRAELFRHSKRIGRANVTSASFREHLRAQHHPTGDQP